MSILTAGTYTITYNVSDAAGNAAAEVTRDVIVDGTAPVIALLGADPIKLKVGNAFVEPSFTATDDGDVSGSVVVAGDVVDTGTAGTYTISIFDEWLNGLLLHISQQMKRHETAALNHSEDWRLFFLHRASTRLTFASAAFSPLALDHFGLPFMACYHIGFITLYLIR